MAGEYPHLNIEKYPARGNTVRNVFFVFLCFAAAGYGLVRLGIVRDLSGAEPPAVESAATEPVIGGDVLIPIHEPEFARPIWTGTEMFDAETLTAQSALVKDRESGAVLFQKNVYEPHAPASITKLMSALVLLEEERDWMATTTAVGEQLFDTIIQKDFQYAVEDLWHAGLIASSNRAMVTLVHASGFTEEAFAARMNQKARELGMSDTVFYDSAGLDARTRTTASDSILLLKEVERFEKITRPLGMAEYTLTTASGEHERHMWNTNWLLIGWIPHTFASVGAAKTGYIPESGYNFVTSVTNDAGVVLDVVVLGARDHETRFTEARDIAEWVFENYEWRTSE